MKDEWRVNCPNRLVEYSNYDLEMDQPLNFSNLFVCWIFISKFFAFKIFYNEVEYEHDGMSYNIILLYLIESF